MKRTDPVYPYTTPEGHIWTGMGIRTAIAKGCLENMMANPLYVSTPLGVMVDSAIRAADALMDRLEEVPEQNGHHVQFEN